MNNYYVPQPVWGNPNATTQIIPQQYLPSQIPIQPKESDNNGFVWIQGGKTVAQAYPVAPGQTVGLRDSENPVIYVKSTDDNGKPRPMEVFKRVEEEEIEEPINAVEFIKKEDLFDYVKKSDIEDIFKDLQGIKDALLEIQTAPEYEAPDNNNTRRWK